MANEEKRNYVAVLPDNTEHPFELSSYGLARGFTRYDFESTLVSVLSSAGLKTSRKNPQTVQVRCFQLTIKGAALVRTPVGTYQVQPPLSRMTTAEFNEEQATQLQQVPAEFHSALVRKAWEDGHASGYEEVLRVLDSLIAWLEAPLKAYTGRIRQEKE